MSQRSYRGRVASKPERIKVETPNLNRIKNKKVRTVKPQESKAKMK